VRLRLEGHCSGCPSSTATLKLAVEDAIRDAAPEVLHVVADGAVEEPLPNALPMVGDTARPGVWSVLDALPELESGGTLVRGVSGEEVLFARVDSALYAYRRGCPACGGSVAAAVVDGGRLACEDCGHRYEIAAAGRCADDPGLSLDPLPLLMTDDGRVKVAHREVVRR